MFALIFENGIVTLSWYAWLALRRRVSMSAIGSVIVMGIRQPFSPGFPRRTQAYGEAVLLSRLPGSLGNAGELTAVGHVPDADAAQAELAVHRVRPPALLATRVRPHGEL